ncbi:MAG: hypothetical protein MK135_17785 [Polyangiaceae bacterium]|nr:hypothetical protein [Polyangiaceae bacterium]
MHMMVVTVGSDERVCAWTTDAQGTNSSTLASCPEDAMLQINGDSAFFRGEPEDMLVSLRHENSGEAVSESFILDYEAF